MNQPGYQSTTIREEERRHNQNGDEASRKGGTSPLPDLETSNARIRTLEKEVRALNEIRRLENED